MADEVLQQGVRSITDLIVNPGMINLDFADIRSVMNEMGKAMMGTGEADGPNRALEAAERAIANPLLDGVSMQGAKGVIISIIGGDDMKLLEVDEAANHIRELVDSEANIIWGTAFNPDLAGKIRVSVVATGIEQSADHQIPAHQPVNLGTARGPKAPAATSGMAAPAAFGGFAAAAPAATAPEPEAAPEVPDTDELLDLADSLEQQDAEGALPEPADASEFGRSKEDGFASLTGLGDANAPEEDDALDLSGAAELAPHAFTATAPQDELTLDAGRLAQDDGEVAGGMRRRRLFGAGDMSGEASEPVAAPAAAAAPAPAGTTLFERMANIVPPAAESDRGEEEEDGDGSGPGFRIPRFLNRTNNQ